MANNSIWAGIGAGLQGIGKRQQEKQLNAFEQQRIDLEKQRIEQMAKDHALQIALRQDALNATKEDREARLGEQTAQNLAPTNQLDPTSKTTQLLKAAGYGAALSNAQTLPSTQFAGGLNIGDVDQSQRSPIDINSLAQLTQTPPKSVASIPQNNQQISGMMNVSNSPSQNTGMLNWAGTRQTQAQLANEEDRRQQNTIANNFRKDAQNDRVTQYYDNQDFKRQTALDANANRRSMAELVAGLRQTPNFTIKDQGGNDVPAYFAGGKLQPMKMPDGYSFGSKMGGNGGKLNSINPQVARQLAETDSTLQEALRLRANLEKSGVYKSNNPLDRKFQLAMQTGLGMAPSGMYPGGVIPSDIVQNAGYVNGMALKSLISGSGARGQLIQQTIGAHIPKADYSGKLLYQTINDTIREYTRARQNLLNGFGVKYEEHPFNAAYDINSGADLPNFKPLTLQEMLSLHQHVPQKAILNPDGTTSYVPVK